ncbi:hypothetical protein E2K73_07825 [Acinetobacter sp. RF15A]|uniref:hypothetical protein n=1 Tax=unclassified Acinetobacter TaxID=196816 RepID=UPI001195E56C|nr:MULTISPECIES: hypothetical protein [unclassified Acinetobacter]TSH74909.1 hypothetical protein E2K73_07825 [Acinetobacter sp. RF15A]TSI20394.1 hypothetical protein E2K74_02880 [Acinetobacter sp. RF15B]
MNLIEKLGLEKCRQIVDGAPEGSEMWRDMDSVCSPGEVLYYWWFGGALLVHDGEKGWIKSIYHDGNEYILDQLELLSDIKSEIDHHYYGRSEAEELASYAVLSQEKIEGSAMLVGDFSKARERIQSVFDDGADYVTDIRNHISPNMKVVEHE